MQNNTILIVDGDGNCIIEQGGPLTAADAEGRPDINLTDLNFSTAREKWRLETSTKIEYDLHGFLNNIYYEAPGAPGMYQSEPPQYPLASEIIKRRHLACAFVFGFQDARSRILGNSITE